MSDQARVRELQSALNTKVAENKAIADTFKTEDGVIIIDQERKAAFDANMASIKDIRALIEAEKAMDEVEAWGREAEGESVATKSAAQAATSGLLVPQYKSLGQRFVESEEFKALNGGRNGLTMTTPFEVKTLHGGYEVKDVYSSLPDAASTPTYPTYIAPIVRAGEFGSVDRDPMVMPPMRQRRVRDLFPSRSTTAAVIEFFRVTGFTNAASVVAERDGASFTNKPQAALAFTGQQAPTRTIAHWEAAHRNALADEPQLRSIIDNELLYGLRLEEDNQLINGDGNGENLLGILAAPGTQSYSWSSGATTPVPDTKVDALRRAATLSFLAYYEPTGILVHPSDWEEMELTKNTQGSYLVAVSVVNGADARVWRLPVIDTPACPEGTAVVGAFGTACQIYDREQATVRVAEQHSDFFTRNAVVVLAEERLAFAIKRPESLVEVTFDGQPG